MAPAVWLNISSMAATRARRRVLAIGRVVWLMC
jgi:hypothetical protein